LIKSGSCADATKKNINKTNGIKNNLVEKEFIKTSYC
jgi:hypothetical protein